MNVLASVGTVETGTPQQDKLHSEVAPAAVEAVREVDIGGTGLSEKLSRVRGKLVNRDKHLYTVERLWTEHIQYWTVCQRTKVVCRTSSEV